MGHKYKYISVCLLLIRHGIENEIDIDSSWCHGHGCHRKHVCLSSWGLSIFPLNWWLNGKRMVIFRLQNLSFCIHVAKNWHQIYGDPDNRRKAKPKKNRNVRRSCSWNCSNLLFLESFFRDKLNKNWRAFSVYIYLSKVRPNKYSCNL